MVRRSAGADGRCGIIGVANALQAFAPAKVNLFLHVGAPAADGYHPLCSLMVFADVGDRLASQPSDAMEFSVKGPFAPALSDARNNLVIRARDALMEAAGSRNAAFALTLHKTLPIASGSVAGQATRLPPCAWLTPAWDLTSLIRSFWLSLGRWEPTFLPASLLDRSSPPATATS